MPSPVQQIVEADKRRRDFLGQKAKKKFRRPPVPVSVNGIEVQYASDLAALVSVLKKTFEQDVASQLPRIAVLAEMELRSDDIGDDQITGWQKTVRALFAAWAAKFPFLFDEKLDRIVSLHSGSVNVANIKTFNRQVSKLVGVNVLTSDPGLKAALSAWRTEGKKLWGNVTNDFADIAEATVIREFRAGRRQEQIAKMLSERLGVTASRAKLIAVDQVQKLNGELTRRRQKQSGVTSYIWRTSRDERVRPKHAMREGREFSWDDPPDDGHPGSAPRCRCFGEPALDALLD